MFQKVMQITLCLEPGMCGTPRCPARGYASHSPSTDTGASAVAIQTLFTVEAYRTMHAVVWKFDRLGRSLGFLCDLVNHLGQQRAHFQSMIDGIDTTTISGKRVFHVMGALAEFERDLIRERTKAGMKAAKKRCKHVGRPKALSPGQVQHMRDLLAAGKMQREVAELLGVSANTVGRAIKIRE